MTITRRQHHVWRSYLKSWATNDQIYCLQEGRIFQSNIDSVGVQRDFYKLQPLNVQDIKNIRVLIGHASPSAQRVHDNFLQMFSLPAFLKENMPSELAEDGEYKKFLDKKILMIEEEFHGKYESAAEPILRAIKQRDLSFYSDDKKCMTFIHFLCLQYFRTRAIKESVLSRTIDPSIFDLDKCWGVLRHIFATNVGGSLFVERKKRKLILLENNTEMPFVTGDQPAVNLFHASSREEAPDQLVIYYPITPWLALILEECDTHSGYESNVSANQVIKLNHEISTASCFQLLGHTEEILKSLNVSDI